MEEKKPSPKAVGQDAAGNLSTGIIEAERTNERRKIEPLKVSGNTSQAGRRRVTEAGKQAEEISQNHPFVPKVNEETDHSRARLETGK
jgi:hypothetical protein